MRVNIDMLVGLDERSDDHNRNFPLGINDCRQILWQSITDLSRYFTFIVPKCWNNTPTDGAILLLWMKRQHMDKGMEGERSLKKKRKPCTIVIN